MLREPDVVTGHFDKVAAEYELNYQGDNIVSHSFNSRLGIVLSLLGDIGKCTVLDIGCGPGILAKRLLPYSCAFTGIDISESMIQECLKDESLSRFSFLAIDPLSFFSQSHDKYDIITAMGLFEYLSDSYSQRLLGEIVDHLLPSGVFIATYPNILSPYRSVDRIFRLCMGKETMVPPYTPGVQHKEFFEMGLRDGWRKQGLEVVSVAYYNFRLIPKPLDLKLKRYDLFLAKRLQFLSKSPLSFLGTAMVLKGRKI